MRSFRLLPLLVLAALAAPAAAHAAPLAADFTIQPAAPQAGQPVTFTNTSTGGSGTVTPHWDLDDDGEYDNGTTQTVTRSFPAGQHTVRLLVMSVGPTTETDRVSKTFTVAVPSTPTPTPTPTPTATPMPTGDNQAPQARIDLGCGALRRGVQLCLNEYARVGAPKTFDASPSQDADGRIVRYEWDLDGDGSYETDTGGEPRATRTYGDLDPLTVRLRVTDDRGATGETQMALKKTQPDCERRAAHKLLSAVSPCFRHYRYEAGDGKKLGRPDGMLHSGRGYSGDEYRTDQPLIVNGIGITPAPGKTVSIRIIDWKDDGHPRVDIVSTGALATARAGEDVLTVDEGRIHWRLEGKALHDVVMPDGQKLGGLPVVGMARAPELRLGSGSGLAFTVRMPQQFGAPTSDKPVMVTLGGARALASTRRTAAADAPLHFEVEHAVLGPMELNKLSLDYDGNGMWEIAADVTLPPPANARVKADAGILNGGFNYAGADVEFLDQGLNIIGPVFLKRIKFRVEVEPKRSECVPHVGVEPRPTAGPGLDIQVPGMDMPKTIDYGVPTFALCGEVGMIVGPTIAGESALRLDAGLGFAMFADRPAVLRAFGEAKVMGMPLADGSFELHGDGYIEADAHAKWVWPGVALMEGGIGLEMLGSKFNLHGHVDACVWEVDWCVASARAVASNAGVAVCLKIDYELETWEPGIGYRWGETPTIYFAGCELGPYKTRVEHARAAQAGAAGERTFSLRSGLPGAAIALEGQDAPPQVTLIGPRGERVTTPADGKALKQGPFLVLQSRAEKLTQIAVVAPSGGDWRIVPESGSSPITALKTADGVEPPKVEAKVVGRGQRRAIAYEIAARPGQQVAFAERGDTAGRIIGRAQGRRGRIRFRPAAGAAERRHIVAIVEQNGMPSAQFAVASYRAPRAARPGRPRGVRVTGRRRSVTVRWARDGAPSHVVTVAAANGRRVVRRVDRRHRLVVRGIGKRATVTVKAIGRSGLLGPAARARR